MTPTTKLFDIWLFLDEALGRELENADTCARMHIQQSPESRTKIQIYRGLLNKFSDADLGAFNLEPKNVS